ncbi:tetrapyrrole methylase [Neoconidiobolus thromboides FSU 785]|nr:tetrapyrrole methylase [Neoconidiobolus thromboides FSU 785]
MEINNDILHNNNNNELIQYNNININTITTQAQIYLIGAGPGDIGLLTLKAKQIIEQADLVLADKLISKEILNLVRGELKIANKYQGNQINAQNELNEYGKQGLIKGQLVVRLKGGDPFIFGRGGEEVLYYRKLGYEPKIIPGISSCLSAPLLANIPITHRSITNQFLVCTGTTCDNRIINLPIYEEQRTLILLMAVHKINEVQLSLRELKYPDIINIAIIENASRDNQRNIFTTLKELIVTANKFKIQSPSIIVIGNSVNTLY